MSNELQVLQIIIPIIVAVSLHVARIFFTEAKEVRPTVDSRNIDSLHRLASNVLKEMQDDVERFFYLPDPQDGLGIEYHAHRREGASNQIAIMIWEEAKKQKDIENVFNSWSQCEASGRFICGIGTFLNLGILVVLLAIVITKSTQVIINNSYFWIGLLIISIPILCALICYLVAFGYKRKFFKIRDR